MIQSIRQELCFYDFKGALVKLNSDDSLAMLECTKGSALDVIRTRLQLIVL